MDNALNSHWWNTLPVEQQEDFRDGLYELMFMMENAIIDQGLANWRKQAKQYKKLPLSELEKLPDVIATKKRILAQMQRENDPRADEWQKSINAYERILAEKQNDLRGENVSQTPKQ